MVSIGLRDNLQESPIYFMGKFVVSIGLRIIYRKAPYLMGNLWFHWFKDNLQESPIFNGK